ncbi:arginine-tRNA-protein transferase [Gloeopeniophorella convolvens]|nr:arginine-tRNA-protein transferase [Gloeopeniophorella convolvens]
MFANPTIVEAFPPQNSSCGYCHSNSETSFQSGSLHAHRMSCSVYQRMIDRGWRRSGLYCYKPDLRRSCCPQYTIKLDATQFKASKSQRKLMNRWNHYVLGDNDAGARVADGPAPRKGKGASKEPQFILEDAIHAPENLSKHSQKPAHVFEVTLEPSSFTEEKFALYQSYEAHIHKKPEKHSGGFKRFLIESPLQREPIPYPSAPPAHLPSHYGSYHQLYRLDGRLIGMSVIDILPSCVSSVYFMWEREYEKWSLGKLSALREITLAKELHDAGVPQLRHLYMGYYIYTCQKMKYKGEYSPSFLADPEDFTWHPLSECQKSLDKHRYACFTHPERSLEGLPPSLETDPPPQIPAEKLSQVYLVSGVQNGRTMVAPVTESQQWKSRGSRNPILYAVGQLGVELAQEIIFVS